MKKEGREGERREGVGEGEGREGREGEGTEEREEKVMERVEVRAVIKQKRKER